MKIHALTAAVLGGAAGGVALWLGGEALAVLVRRIAGPSLFGSDWLTWLVLQRVALGAWLGSSFAALALRKHDDSAARLVFQVLCSVLVNVWLTVPIFAALAERIFGR